MSVISDRPKINKKGLSSVQTSKKPLPLIQLNSMAVNISVVSFLVVLAIVARLMPHPPNFAPIAAIALFAGIYFRSSLAMLIPVGSLAISDWLIGAYDFRVMAVVYVSLSLPVLFSRVLAKVSPIGLLAGSLSCSVLFFLASNFAVWMFIPVYSGNIAGLLECYVAALPFFKNTLCGDLFWTFSIFGSYALCARLSEYVHRFSSTDLSLASEQVGPQLSS